MVRMLFVVSSALSLGACSTILPPGDPKPASTSTGPSVRALLKTADGADRGTATLTMVDGVMRLSVDAMGFTPGAKGVHIHDVGKCEGPDFASAKGHWNPTTRQHGRDNPMGAHHGDLPNLLIGTDGRGLMRIDVPGTMAQLLDADGASVIIHAQADDYRTDPSGNSGGRIACGILTAP